MTSIINHKKLMIHSIKQNTNEFIEINFILNRYQYYIKDGGYI